MYLSNYFIIVTCIYQKYSMLQHYTSIKLHPVNWTCRSVCNHWIYMDKYSKCSRLSAYFYFTDSVALLSKLNLDIWQFVFVFPPIMIFKLTFSSGYLSEFTQWKKEFLLFLKSLQLKENVFDPQIIRLYTKHNKVLEEVYFEWNQFWPERKNFTSEFCLQIQFLFGCVYCFIGFLLNISFERHICPELRKRHCFQFQLIFITF